MFNPSLGPKEGRLPPGYPSSSGPIRRRFGSSASRFAAITLFCVLLITYVLGHGSGRWSIEEQWKDALENDPNEIHVGLTRSAKWPKAKSGAPLGDDSQDKGEKNKINLSSKLPNRPPKAGAMQGLGTHSSWKSSDQGKKYKSPPRISSNGLSERPSFEQALRDVLSTLPDEVHMRELTRPIDSGGKERMRELGLRTRLYRGYFEAWENLHLGEDEKTGGVYVRDDVIQYLRAGQDSWGPAHTAPREHSREMGAYRGYGEESHEASLQSQHLAQTILAYESFRSFMADFADFLFPWTAPYFADHMTLHAHLKTGGRGIVLTAGDRHAPWLLTTIYTFRKLGCTLPIEIMYLGESDLGKDYRAELETLPGVTARDLSQMVDDQGWALSGWAAKPFAILLSSFREAIFIDADSLFFRNPEMLFEDPDYQRTGALFFRDRVIMPEPKKRWLQQVLPKPVPELAKQSSWWTGKSGHMQESGVVVVDKWKHFLAMLLVCRFNGSDRDTQDGKEGVYTMMFGDKETFWIGFLLAGDESYAFHRGGTGTMGIIEPPNKSKNGDQAQDDHDDTANDVTAGKEDQRYRNSNHDVDHPQPSAYDDDKSRKMQKTHTLCAPQLLHLGTDGRPLWFNGWLLKDKFAEKSEMQFAEVQSFLVEPLFPRDEDDDAWSLHPSNKCCLTSEVEREGELNRAEKEVFAMMVARAKEVVMKEIGDD